MARTTPTREWRARLADVDTLVLTALIWFLAKFLRYAFPALFPTLRDGYGVSKTVLGTAFTGLMLFYAAMQFPSGILGDRLGATRVVVAGAAVAAGAAALVAVTDAFAWLVVGMVLIGAGTGAHKTVAISLLSRVYPARTGRALGVMDTVGALGGVGAPAAVVATGSVGWRGVFAVGAAAGAVLGALFFRRVPRTAGVAPGPTDSGADDPESDGDAGDEREGDGAVSDGGSGPVYAAMLRRRRFLAFVGVTLLFSVTWNGVAAFLPLYLTSEAGLSEATANLLYGGLFLVSVVQAGTGEVSDRVGQLPVIAATLGLATVSLGALVALPATTGGVVAAAALVGLLGVGGHGFRPVRDAYFVEVIPSGATGGVLGGVRTVMMGVGAVAPAAVGYVADTAGFVAAFGLLAVAVGGATAATVGLMVRDG